MSFCLEEIFEMARQIERDGAEFYRRAAEATEDSDARELFEELASWELKHERIFHNMSRGLPPEAADGYFDPHGEAAGYLRTLVEGRIFDLAVGPGRVVDAASDLPEVIRFAIGKEKQSILFYVGLRDVAPGGADQVDQIIREEMRHIRILSRLLDPHEPA